MSQWAMSQVIGQVSGFVWSISKKAGGRTDRQPRAKITLEHSIPTYSSNTSLQLEYNLNRTDTFHRVRSIKRVDE